MPQVAIQLDKPAAELLNEVAERDALSPSDWARQAVVVQLQARRADRLPQSFFDVLGTWEDDCEPAEILRRIREDVGPSRREPLD